MTISTAPALLFGLGVRIALNKFSSTADASVDEGIISDVILLGVVQGVALYYALMEYPDFAFVVAFGIAARLVIEFMMLQDVSRCATTLLGVALGVLVTDVLSQLIEDGYFYDFYGDSDRDKESTYTPKRKRLVKFQSSTEYQVIPPSRPPRSRKHESDQRWHKPPSLTSTSSIDPNHTMSPLERELAVLRAKASLADSERRRFKEEKKWAESQGNVARVSQMSWQVKRYTALTQSFTREADARFLEGGPSIHPFDCMFKVVAFLVTAMKQQQQLQPAAIAPIAPQPSNRHQVDRHTNHSRQATQEVVIDRQSTVTVDVERRHRRQSSGNLKSAMRLQVR
jgi:hypothetical protein